MKTEKLINEFAMDWAVRGLSSRTLTEYLRYLNLFRSSSLDFDLDASRTWLNGIPSLSVRRQAARAIRSFGKYLEKHGHEDVSWGREIPLPIEKIRPQRTVTSCDVQNARRVCQSARDRLLIELLWSTGLRRSELARLRVEDIAPDTRSITVTESKAGLPRRVPISPEASTALLEYTQGKNEGLIFSLSAAGIGAALKRLGLPPAHAWRRGWAVDSLRRGVSEVSVRTAAGWKTGAMVARYTAALSEELALAEFERLWRNSESEELLP
jgi:integrase